MSTGQPHNQFPHPESKPPGRAAFESVSLALSDEKVACQSTSRRIEAIYILDNYFVDITCGDRDAPIRRFGKEHDDYLTAEAGQFNSKAFNFDELVKPGGVDALVGGRPPTKRIFRPGKNPEGELSDETFACIMQRMQDNLPAATVKWIHEALRIIQLPVEHSPSSSRVDEIVKRAKAAPEVPLELRAIVEMDSVRVVGGWTLDAVWQTANETALRRGGETIGQTRIRLDNGSQRYSYERDVYGNEAVVAELVDPGEGARLKAIGYDVDERGDWRMWDRDLARIGITPPRDSALHDFSDRVQATLTAERIGEYDTFIHMEDGAIKVRRPDGTIY